MALLYMCPLHVRHSYMQGFCCVDTCFCSCTAQKYSACGLHVQSFELAPLCASLASFETLPALYLVNFMHKTSGALINMITTWRIMVSDGAVASYVFWLA